MENWKELNFSQVLEEWWVSCADKNGDYDKDYKVIWVEVIQRAKDFDLKVKKLRTKTMEFLQTPAGCVFMSKIARRAAHVAEILASFLNLIGWKQVMKDREDARELKISKNAAKEDEEKDLDEEEDQDDEELYDGTQYDGFQGDKMDPSFDLGKLHLVTSFLVDVKDWGEDMWISKVFENISAARGMSYGYYSIYGIEKKGKVGFEMSVDCFIKNLNKNDKSMHLEGIVKGSGKDRILATTEAVMFAHWKIATIEFDLLKKFNLSTITTKQKYFKHENENKKEAEDWDTESDTEPGAKGDAEPGAKWDAESGAKGDAEECAKGDAEECAKGDAEVGAKGDAEECTKGDTEPGAKGDPEAGAKGDPEAGAGGM